MEFLIRCTDDDSFDIMHSDLPAVLHPNTIPYTSIHGRGSACIQVMGCTITCYDEMAGIQVVFSDNTISEATAQQIVEEMLWNIRQMTGKTGEVIQTA